MSLWEVYAVHNLGRLPFGESLINPDRKENAAAKVAASLIASAIIGVALTSLLNPLVLPTIADPGEMGLYFERKALLFAVPISYFLVYPFAYFWLRVSSGSWWSALVAGISYALMWSVALATLNPDSDASHAELAFEYFLFGGAWFGVFGSISFWFSLRFWKGRLG